MTVFRLSNWLLDPCTIYWGEMSQAAKCQEEVGFLFHGTEGRNSIGFISVSSIGAIYEVNTGPGGLGPIVL